MSIYFPTSSQCYWNVNYISKFVQPVPLLLVQPRYSRYTKPGKIRIVILCQVSYTHCTNGLQLEFVFNIFHQANRLMLMNFMIR